MISSFALIDREADKKPVVVIQRELFVYCAKHEYQNETSGVCVYELNTYCPKLTRTNGVVY